MKFLDPYRYLLIFKMSVCFSREFFPINLIFVQICTDIFLVMKFSKKIYKYCVGIYVGGDLIYPGRRQVWAVISKVEFRKSAFCVGGPS